MSEVWKGIFIKMIPQQNKEFASKLKLYILFFLDKPYRNLISILN